MRNRFDEQLYELNREIIEMGAMCEGAIASAAKALSTGNMELAAKVRANGAAIDQMERDIEGRCMKLLLHQQPVARDLRLISAALKMITDMERIADQGSDIAEIARHIDFTTNEKNQSIAQMADITIKMLSMAVSSFVQRDKELALSVQKMDDDVDSLFQQAKVELVDMMCGGGVPDKKMAEGALEMLMIAKYFERIGDHTVNITEAVVTMLNGN